MHQWCVSFSSLYTFAAGLCIILLLLSGRKAHAQDTAWAQHRGDGLYFKAAAIKGDNINTIAARYNVPIVQLSDFNHTGYQSAFFSGQEIMIPVGKTNYKRVEEVASQPLCYKVMPGDKLRSVSRVLNVAQSTLELWNHLDSPQLIPGQTLLLGWVTYNRPDNIPDAASTNAIRQDNNIKKRVAPVVPTSDTGNNNTDTADTVISYTDSIDNVMEARYNKQVAGSEEMETSGAAVFYDYKVKSVHGYYYAFHNDAPRGSLIKITNPATQHTIYAKVIGPIPDLPDYNNSIIAVSGNAAAALGTRYKRFFCKISY